MTAIAQAIDFPAAFARLTSSGVAEETIIQGDVSIRMVRVPGGQPGRWDSHSHSAETAIVWLGDFTVEFRDRSVALSAGQCCVVPVNTKHRGISRDGAEVILITQAGVENRPA